MKSLCTKAMVIIFFCLWIISCNTSKVYYLSSTGDDSNPGTSMAKAWKSVDRVNQQDFSPGDRVLFRGGDIFQGTIILSATDAGTASARLKLSSFGEGKAVISGMESEALKADSCTYLTVENLEFVGMGRKSGNTTDGVLIRQCNNFVLDEVEVYGFQLRCWGKRFIGYSRSFRK